MAAIAAVFCCEAVANASPAPAYQFTMPNRLGRTESAYIPGAGHFWIFTNTDWDAGCYVMWRHVRYFSPGIKARSPEYIETPSGASLLRKHLNASAVCDYRGRLIGHNCLYSELHIWIYPVQWWNSDVP